jgi:carboxylesterase type B
VEQLAGELSLVQIDSGKVQGTVVDGVIAFKVIPFAAPPVGALRWRRRRLHRGEPFSRLSNSDPIACSPPGQHSPR